MNDYVNLSFLLPGGALIAAPVITEDARRTKAAWRAGTLPEVIDSDDLRCRQDVLGFSIRTRDVVAIYLAPTAPMQHPMGAAPPLSPPMGLSGRRW